MPPRHLQILALAMPATLLAVLLWIVFLQQPLPPISLPTTPPVFQADLALATSNLLAYGDRLTGSANHTHVRELIIQKLTALNLTVEQLPFQVTVASEPRLGTQVWATSPGQSDEIIILTTHYDAPPSAWQQPDNIIGVGVALELARVFASEPHQRTLIFVFSDAHTYGRFWGTKNFLEKFPNKNKIVAVLDLDQIGNRTQIEGHGLHSGSAPLYLRALSRAVLTHTGGQVDALNPLAEWVEQAAPLGTSEASVYLREGLPAITWRGDPASDYETPDAGGAGVLTTGPAAELWLRALDQAGMPLTTDATAITISEAEWLPGWAARVAQLLLFAPLFIATRLAFAHTRPTWPDLRPENLSLLGWLTIGLDGFVTVYSLVNLRALPTYDLHPATSGDPFLLWPTWWALALIIGVMAFFRWITFGRAHSWGQAADLVPSPHRRAALLFWFSLVVVSTWALNGASALIFLGLAAYTWIWITPTSSIYGKLLFSALAFIGLMPVLGFFNAFTRAYALGPWLWYFALSAAYGLVPLLTVVLALSVGALAVRFAMLSVREP